MPTNEQPVARYLKIFWFFKITRTVPITIVRDWSFPPPSRKNEYIKSVWSPRTATTPEIDSHLGSVLKTACLWFELHKGIWSFTDTFNRRNLKKLIIYTIQYEVIMKKKVALKIMLLAPDIPKSKAAWKLNLWSKNLKWLLNPTKTDFTKLSITFCVYLCTYFLVFEYIVSGASIYKEPNLDGIAWGKSRFYPSNIGPYRNLLLPIVTSKIQSKY